MGLVALVRRVALKAPAPNRSLASNAPRKRSKSAEKRLRDPDFPRYRQTVSDTFFVALTAAGVSLLGGIAGEKARDPFGLTNTQDISVSGGSGQIQRGDRDGQQFPPSQIVLANRPGLD